MKERIRHADITGMTFGKLYVIKRNGYYVKGRHALWLVKCKCGNEKTVSGNSLRMGKTMSCGCVQFEMLKLGWSYFKGKKRPEISGDKCHLWRGGCDEKIKIRSSLEYKNWRKQVFERDKYTCQFCGEIGGVLNADHIKSFSNYPELRLNLDNGRTLCVKCHKKTDNYGEKAKREIVK